jgi:predicted acylesterase/phospholipase RssA
MALTAMAEAQQGTKCRALAMSGGSNKGAWEVGVLWGLLHYGNPEDYAWDMITGVSTGAINTSATTIFAKGDEYAMSEFMSDAWVNLTSHDIW